MRKLVQCIINSDEINSGEFVRAESKNFLIDKKREGGGEPSISREREREKTNATQKYSTS